VINTLYRFPYLISPERMAEALQKALHYYPQIGATIVRYGGEKGKKWEMKEPKDFLSVLFSLVSLSESSSRLDLVGARGEGGRNGGEDEAPSLLVDPDRPFPALSPL